MSSRHFSQDTQTKFQFGDGHRIEGDARARSLSVAGLFAGIGGIERGLERAGHSSQLLCEIDPAAQAVLEAKYPRVPLHTDIRTLKRIRRDIDLICAGFPCQDLSQAGMTRGIGGQQSGLVSHVFALLERHRVPWVLLENVPFMLQLNRGQALNYVLSSLEQLGYKWAYRVIDTRAFGLPQRRERVFIVGSRISDPRLVLFGGNEEPTNPQRSSRSACGFYWTEGVRGLGWAVDAVPTLKGGSTVGIPSPPAIWMPDGRIVIPDIRDGERLQGFPAEWTSPASVGRQRDTRWKLVGNAVTVDVAEWIGERLLRLAGIKIPENWRLESGSSWPKAGWNVGEGRRAAIVSTWPVRRKARPLGSFLRFPVKPLSTKATSGFLARTKVSSLRFPPGFIEAIELHLEEARKAIVAA